MRVRMCRVGLVVLVASWLGCGDDDGAAVDAGRNDSGATEDAGAIDAGPADAGLDAGTDAGPGVDGGRVEPDFSCLDVPLPTPPDSIAITARIRSNPHGLLEGAHVEVRWRADDSLVFEGDTIADGTVSFEIPTGGAPADVYLVVTADGHATHYLYTGWPLYEDETINFGVFGPEPLPAVADAAHVTIDPSLGMIHLTSRDCALRVIEGAEVFVSPTPEELLYLVGDECFSFVEDLTETGPCGAALALNVPVGRADVTASTADGMAFRMQSVRIEPGALTRITLRPNRP